MLRRLLALAIVAALAAGVIASSAKAVPPTITVNAPVGQAANPVSVTGQAGSEPGDQYSVLVEIFSGDQAEGKPVFSNTVFVNESTREFTAFVDAQLADGVYSARATQSNTEQEKGTSNVVVFWIGAPPATPTPSPSPSPEPTAVVQQATATPTPAATTPPATIVPYVCKSRRDFVKHVPRPAKGKHLKVTATLNGKPYKHTLSRTFVLVRLDLRGMPKDVYTLKVRLEFTRPDGKRVVKHSVERVDYHTCTPKRV